MERQPADRRAACALLAFLAGAVSVAGAQDALLRGTVRSERGEPLGGAAVVVPALTLQTATRTDGTYALSVPAALVRGQVVALEFRARRFHTEVRFVPVTSGEQTVDVSLRPDIGATAAVARLDAADLPVPEADPVRQLAGQVAGVLVTSASGRPGANAGVVLGGIRTPSVAGTAQGPLYVVDGVQLYGGLAAIDPQDIARIEVVTGAAAAPLYGTRGVNGVVRLTTKSGGTATTGVSVHFRTEAGAGDIEHAPQLAREHALLTDAAGRRFCVADAAEPLCARTIDWQAETDRVNSATGTFAAAPAPLPLDPGPALSGDALRQSFQSRQWPTPVYDPVRQVTTRAPWVDSRADASGRTGGTGWYASGSLLRQDGAIRDLSGARRYTARLNLDRPFGSALSAAVRSFYSHGRSDGVNQEDEGSLFLHLSRQPVSTDLLARDPLGRLYARSTILGHGDGNPNPLLYTTGNGITDALTTDRALAGASVQWAPLGWLTVEGTAGYDRLAERWDYVVPAEFHTQGASWAIDSGYARVRDRRAESLDFGLDLSARPDLGRELSVVWSLRYESEKRNVSQRDFVGVPSADGSRVIVDERIEDTAFNTVRFRLTGLLAGASFAYRGRYALDLLLRRDQAALGGASRRATLASASALYRPSRERWWPLPEALSDVRLRASLSRSGGLPGFAAPGQDSLDNLFGIEYPTAEHSTERAVGASFELFRRVGVDVSLTHTATDGVILPFLLPTELGFATNWFNTGRLTASAWDVSVDVPVVRTRDVSWSWRFNYDRSRAVFGKLDTPPTFFGGTNVQAGYAMLMAKEGERYGTFYGYYVLRGAADCARLPAGFTADCGTPGSSFQVNSDGYLVWVGKDAAGAAYTVGDGLTRNLWMTRLAAASAPWGVPLNWGMPITYRDTTGGRAVVPIGNALPDWHLSVSQNLRWRRLTVYALLEAVIGREVWNMGRHWAYLDFANSDVDQRGASPETAKPIGYYFRAGAPESGAGLGGLYQTLNPYNGAVEDASFAKLRELSVTWHIGRIGVAGDWDVSLIGRNVFTLTRYRGYDPEVGIAGSPYASATVNAIDAYTFPNLRTVTLALSARF